MTDNDQPNERGSRMKTSKRETPPTRAVLEDSPSHLLHRVLQIALDIYNEAAGEGALTQRQFAVLKALDGSEGGISQTDLVKATGIDRSTLADLVARMLTRELLARERSLTDARANLVRIADAGRAALVEAGPRVMAADSKILSLLSPPKRDSFVKLLRKITTAREEELAEADDEAATAARVLRKAEKAEKKAHKKRKGHGHRRADKLAKRLKKLPMPPLSEGAANEDGDEPVIGPVVVPLKA